MLEDRRVGVVVPAYNEAPFVGGVIETMPAFVDRVYAIDDASTDATWSEIKRRTDRFDGTDGPRLIAIRHERNRGVGAAIKTGYRRALVDGMDVVAVMAGDGQMDPDSLEAIFAPVIAGRAAYAKGNRFHRRGDRDGMSRWRVFGNGLLTLLTRAASGYWQMTDPQNGYTAIDARVLASLPTDELYDRYGFANDLLAVLNARGHRIADVAHPATYGDERSDIRYGSFVPSLSWLLLRRFLWRLKSRYLIGGFHPLVVCYPIGLAALVGGVAALAYGVVRTGGLLEGLVATTVGLIGALFLVLAVWFDVDENADLVLKDEGLVRTAVGPEEAPPHGTGRATEPPLEELEGLSR